MTSDAKLGLLLGLGLIIAIVFAVNGLPGLIFEKMSKPAITDGPRIVREPSEDIMAIARNAARSLSQSQQEQTSQYKPIEQQDVEAAAVPSYAIETPKPVNNAVQTADNSVRTYIVMPNDNLAVIAKKHYGEEEGNRLVNIEKIVKANNLSADGFIRQGQKLKIPALELSDNPNFVVVDKIAPVRSSSNVRSVIPLPTVSAVGRTNNKYTVQEGDTLWSMAVRFLGDGSRYDEICKANGMSEGETLSVGMSIVIPKGK